MMLLKPISVNISGIFFSLRDDPGGKMREEVFFMRLNRAN